MAEISYLVNLAVKGNILSSKFKCMLLTKVKEELYLPSASYYSHCKVMRLKILYLPRCMSELKSPNSMIDSIWARVASVHQNPATDNPFVAKNQNLYFRGRCIWFDV